jgi:steroid 5-alpha reductase family enzyme
MFLEIVQSISLSFCLLFVLMTIIWIIQNKNKNAGLVDVAWAISFSISMLIYYFYYSENSTLRKNILLIMVIIWSLRLTIYLFKRNWGKPEDARYTNLRKEWGDQAGIKLFGFFQFQALLAALLTFPFAIISMNPSDGFTGLEILGLILWNIGLIGESIADNQLRSFKANVANKGKICEVGLWNYSRHPNYFFEWLVWVSFFVFALSSEYGWISIICPLLMYHFLVNVTGIKYTEEHMLATRGEAFRKYIEATSAFVPWFKKKIN